MIGTLIIKRRAPAAFEALNRRDLEAFLEGWAEDASFVYPGDIPGVSGTHTGKAAIRAWFQRLMVQYPTAHFTIKHVAITNLFDITGTNVVAVHWEVEATNRDGFQIQNSGVTVTTARHGKAIHVKDYLFDTGEKWRTAWGEGKL